MRYRSRSAPAPESRRANTADDGDLDIPPEDEAWALRGPTVLPKGTCMLLASAELCADMCFFGSIPLGSKTAVSFWPGLFCKVHSPALLCEIRATYLLHLRKHMFNNPPPPQIPIINHNKDDGAGTGASIASLSAGHVRGPFESKINQ